MGSGVWPTHHQEGKREDHRSPSTHWALSSKAVILCNVDMADHLEDMELSAHVADH